MKQYIDLAAQMGWPYCLVDWEWPEMTNGGDINDVMAYAKQKGVKINLWYNSGTSLVGPHAPQPQDRLNTAESREREMQWLESIGASGIKVDFFSPDNDTMVNYYIDILKDAARHHLLVNFHGCTIPNGWQRTWPNMVSMEGIYGAEWYNNYELMTTLAPPHNATVVYHAMSSVRWTIRQAHSPTVSSPTSPPMHMNWLCLCSSSRAFSTWPIAPKAMSPFLLRQDKSIHTCPPHGTTPNSSQAIQARVPLLLAVQGKLGTLQELTAQMKK